MITGKVSEGKKEYWSDSMDSRKLAIRFLKNLWMVLVGIIVGMIIGGAAYFLYHAITDTVKYQAESEFYLTFATDEAGEAYQWYNGYTWNDLMSSDPIADGTLSRLSDTDIDIYRLEEDTAAEIKSDIRVLKITFTDADIDTCQRLQKATEESLVEFGLEAREFDEIAVIKSRTPVKAPIDNRLFQALLLGGIIGFILALLFMWFAAILDDLIMVPGDVYDLGIPVLGVRLKNSDEALSKFLGEICDDNLAAFAGDKPADTVFSDKLTAVNLGELIKLDGDCFKAIPDDQSIILEIPYRRVKKSLLRLAIDALTIRGKAIYGLVITDADNLFYKMYYLK